MPKHLQLKKCCGIIGASAALGLIVYESYKCAKILRKPLNTNFMSRRCEFIYIKHDYFREPVRDFLNELFQEETLIYSVLYNLKKKFTFTKVGQP